QFKYGHAQILKRGEPDFGARRNLVQMRIEGGVNLVVIDPQPRSLRCFSRWRHQQGAKSQKSREDAKGAPQVDRHSGGSPGNDNPFPMMKILTQKMLGAQDSAKTYPLRPQGAAVRLSMACGGRSAIRHYDFGRPVRSPVMRKVVGFSSAQLGSDCSQPLQHPVTGWAVEQYPLYGGYNIFGGK